MKKGILLGSLGSSILATCFGISGILSGGGSLMGMAIVLGLLGVASFFVGLAFPSDIVETKTYTTESNGMNGTTTVKVANN